MTTSLTPGRKCRDAGQSAAEYAAVLVAAVTLILALLLLASPWGRQIACVIGSALDRLTGGAGYSCSADSPQAGESREPTTPCTLSASTHKRAASQTMLLTLETGGTIKVETMSDGTYRVTQTGTYGGKLWFRGIRLLGQGDL